MGRLQEGTALGVYYSPPSLTEHPAGIESRRSRQHASQPIARSEKKNKQNAQEVEGEERRPEINKEKANMPVGNPNKTQSWFLERLAELIDFIQQD